MSVIHIALVQGEQIQHNPEAALKKGMEYCAKAKSMGADIVLFPEMWNIGYAPPFENAFDFPDESGHDKEILDWFNMAVDENSHFISSFKNCARELELCIAITFLKKGAFKPYNSLSVIDYTGKTVLDYSKVHTCDFSMEKFCEKGNRFDVACLNTAKGSVKVGAMICFDREFPESARTLALKGAEIILIPNCCPIDDNRKSQLKTRAFENMTAVAMANYAGKTLGHSMAFDAMAYDENGVSRNMLLVELAHEEGIAMASVDLDALRGYRRREVWGGKYRRPDAYIC